MFILYFTEPKQNIIYLMISEKNNIQVSSVVVTKKKYMNNINESINRIIVIIMNESIFPFINSFINKI